MVTKDEASPGSQGAEDTRKRTEGDTCQRVAGLNTISVIGIAALIIKVIGIHEHVIGIVNYFSFTFSVA